MTNERKNGEEDQDRNQEHKPIRNIVHVCFLSEDGEARKRGSPNN
jgi:hypothetical protein